jgi:hypothetical protein
MKSNDFSTAPKKLTTKMKRKELDAEMSLGDKRYWSISKDKIINIAKDLLLMFEEDNKMISSLKWRRKHDLSASMVTYYKKKYTEFNDLVTEFDNLVGWRIFEKAMYRECDAVTSAKGLGMFNTRYRSFLKWQNDLKKDVSESGQSSQIITVKLPTFIESGKVPDKETE